MPTSSLRAPTAPTPLDQAIADHEAGRLDQALRAYQSLSAANPTDADLIQLQGLAALDQNRPTDALTYAERALAFAPANAAAHNTRARALSALGRPNDAQAAYRLAFRYRPDNAAIANNLACLLRTQGQLTDAISWFHRAAALAPTDPDIAVNLAQALTAAGMSAASLTEFQRALRLRPRCPATLHAQAQAQLAAALPQAAEASLRAAIRLSPHNADCHSDLGIALDRQGRGQAASQSFRVALRCDPNHAAAHYNLGCLLLLDNQAADARAHQDRALQSNPLHGPALWARCMAELPMLYHTPAEIPAARARYAQALDQLNQAPPATRAALAAAAGSSQPFFLPYQGRCERDLQARYGRLLASLFPPDPAIVLPGRAPGERIRLTIVTAHACEHTLWRLMILGWLTHLDRTRIHVHLVHTGHRTDAQTQHARTLADHYTGPDTDPRAAILQQRPHVLLYPELGMDPTCTRLAAERLAPLQCVAWGHPQTSGLPTIDAYLSSDAMEPPAAALHYTEPLVRLPGLGVTPMLQHAPPAPAGRSHWGLRASATVFWCGQALYKYLPQHDSVLTRIAAAVPDSQFLFIGFARSTIATAQFHQRLARLFTAHGHDPAHHLVMAEPMDQPHFLASAAASDIVLDSIGWSGGKSTLDLLDTAPVIVTLEGGLMRARHTASILRGLGILDTITLDIETYIATAIALAQDPPRRAALSARLKAARTPEPDLRPIRGLEAFMEAQLKARRGALPLDPAGVRGPQTP